MIKHAKDIPDRLILNYLADRQGSWTCYWEGYFKDKDPSVSDIHYAVPDGSPVGLVRYKLKRLYKRGLIGGCVCGCRGDFEITDKGLKLIGRERNRPYTGY